MFTEKLITPPEFFPFVEASSGRRVTGVQWTNPLETSNWDAQLAQHDDPARSFFHSSAWAKVLTETYGYKPYYFVTQQSGVIHSLLPVMEVHSALTGKRAVALPFTDNCDPLCNDRANFKELFRNAIELGRLQGWKYVEFRGGQNLLHAALPAFSFYGHTVALPADENEFYGKLKSPVRRAIRKAEKSGVRIEISQDGDAMKQFYLLHCKSRKRHGLPPQPFLFFQNIHKHVMAKNLGAVVLAHWKKTPIAASVFFDSNGAGIYKFGASDEKYQHLRGNNLVFWEAIRWVLRRGSKKLDLGRTSVNNEGLRRFKLGWNAQEKYLGYFRYSLQHDKFVAGSDGTSGWHNRIFRALPSFASQMIGNVLYRHWA